MRAALGHSFASRRGLNLKSPSARWLITLARYCRRLFLAFQCESFGFDDFATDENGELAPVSRLYLTAALNVECYAYLRPGGSTEHVPILVTAWIFIVLWPLAMPILYAVLLHKCRSAIKNHQPSALSRATRFLWSEYRDSYYWYEVCRNGT